MAQNLAQLTDMWMVNPTMFDPTQQSNQFSNYNNAALPWPPTYNTGGGGPVNAATGQQIPSFQQWQQQNPGGMSINATPAAPAAPPPQQQYGRIWEGTGTGGAAGGQNAMGSGGPTAGQNVSGYGPIGPALQQPAPQAAAPQPQASGPPNNWQAAINALSNPGKVTTMGANVPQVTGYQPSGGVNQAFLQQAGSGAGMNTNFLNALRSIQARPQG
jgi:hypothetical protein